MGENRRELIDSYLSELQIQLLNGGLTHCRPNWGIKDIKPEYNKMYYIRDGEGWIRIGDKDFYPKAGQFVFIPSGTLHSFSTINENTYRKYWCHFTSNIVFAPLFQYYGLPYIIDTTGTDEIGAAFAKLFESRTRLSSSQSLRVKAAVFEIVSSFIDRCLVGQDEYASPVSIQKLHKLTQHIDSRLEHEIKIEELAELMHFNTNYLFKFMKSHLGMTPMQYIYKRRLERAKYMLTGTDVSLGEIAGLTGFSDIYHFSKTFKKYVGITPKEFRNARGS